MRPQDRRAQLFKTELNLRRTSSQFEAQRRLNLSRVLGEDHTPSFRLFPGRYRR